MNAAKTSMSSKILGPESSYFAEMAVDAVTAVRMESGGDVGKKASVAFFVLFVDVVQDKSAQPQSSETVLAAFGGKLQVCPRDKKAWPDSVP